MCRYAVALLRGGTNEHGRVLELEPLSRLDERMPAMGLAFLLAFRVVFERDAGSGRVGQTHGSDPPLEGDSRVGRGEPLSPP